MKEFNEFCSLLEKEDKQQAVKYALSLLDSGTMNVVTLYTQVLAPSLNQMKCLLEDKRICIWKEHVRTAIVRTIVECCYPYIARQQKNADAPRKTALVVCPPEEYHDLGARMVADFFTLCGWEAIFVGSNTPYRDFVDAVELIRPAVVAISVSNYYNLVATKMIISDMKQRLGDTVKVLVGGSAVLGNEENFKTLGADYCAQSFEEIQRILEEVSR